MKKSFLVSIILILLGCQFLSAQYKISQIEFEGLKNIKISQIKSRIKTKKGDVFNQQNLKLDIQELLSTEYFDNVEIEFDTSTRKLIYKFQERPLIKKIEIRGNKKISSRKIKEEITLREKEFFNEIKLQESKEKILQLYDENGYFDTIVESDKILDEKNNQLNIIFFIQEGRKIIVEKIDILGNKQFSKRKILSLMEIKRKKIFREVKLKEDIKKIVDFYKDNGFYDIEISTTHMKFINDLEQKLLLTIELKEGKKYSIEAIEFVGNSVYKDKEFLKVIPLKIGKIYKQSEVETAVQNIAELYAEKGYLTTNIVYELKKDIQKGTIKVSFIITEGEIFYIDRIYIDGLTTTKEDVIKREVLLKEGENFNSKKLRRSVEKIYNLGFLDDVKVDLQPAGPNKVDLVFNITEGRPGMLSAGAGYSSVDKLVGNLQVSHLNLFGRAQRLTLMWEFGERRQNYEISWTEPWFLKKPLSLGFSLYDLTRVREYSNEYNAYKEQRQGGEVRLGPRLSEKLSLLFSYSYENVKIFEVVDKFKNEITEGQKITSSLSSQIIYDSRDYIFDASKGARHSLSLQVAGWSMLGGDVRFFKPILRSSVFIPTFWKFVLSFNFVCGYVEGIDNYDLENVKYEKFYVGGADTVRGYPYRMLAPENGGRIMLVFNTEYKFPIVQENKRTVLQGAVFYDVGGAWNDFKDVKLEIAEDICWKENGLWDNKLKHSVGFGIRFTTPVFPIRLDWAWALNPTNKLSDRLQFWFTLGQMF